MADEVTGGTRATIDVAAAVLDYVRGAEQLEGTTQIARYTVDHVRDVTGAEWAELVTTSRGGAVEVLATADREVTDELMQARLETANPPPPDAALATQTVVVEDLSAGSPWGDFGSVAVERTPVRSAVLPYFTVAGGPAAVLPVYDRRPGYFSADRQRYVRLLAELSALALSRVAAGREAGQLAAGLRSRGEIGTAVGLLMATLGVEADAAFDLLRVTSQRRNRKLVDLAREVVATGALPGTSPSAG
ncbi:ANTAR domain-containing protein [uncultured Friedmanniella sp.]|uniref:ANTAR domain-containing protein n=1 Tax=uncultured Friedmanniella sp. TaxID=335381 RepID=UPI0035CC274D